MAVRQASLAQGRGGVVIAMTVLDRYVIRLVLPTTLTALLLLLLLFSAYISVDLLRSAAFGNLSAQDVFYLVLAHDLSALEVLLPTAFFASLVGVMTSWHSQGEPYAFYAAGVQPDRVSTPLWMLCVAIALGVLLTTNLVRPYAYELRYAVNQRASNLSSEQMQPQHFYQWDKNFVVQAQRIRPERPNLADVFAYSQSEDRTVVLHAQHGDLSPTDKDHIQRILFINGTSYEFQNLQPGHRTTQFDELEYIAERPAADRGGKRRARSTSALIESDDQRDLGEAQWRFCLPIVTLLVCLMGIELGRVRPGQSPYARLAVAIVMYIAVFNAFNSALYAVQIGTLPVSPGLFGVVGFLLLIYIGLRRMPTLTLARLR